MHLNADAGVPLSLRVCLGHVPSPYQEKTRMRRWHFLHSRFIEKKCWCVGWNGVTTYFNMFLTWTVRIPCRALSRVQLDTVSAVTE